MAWLSSNSFTSGSLLSHVHLNNLANDVRAWGGDVNAGGYALSNVPTISMGSGVAAKKLAVFESGANFYGFGLELGGFGAAMRHVAGTTGGHSFYVDSTLLTAFMSPGGRLVIGNSTDPQAQAHIFGAGQGTAALSDAGARGGTLYCQDSNGAGGNGGAIMFGAVQGYFAAIKSKLFDGGGTTTGDLSISLRASTANSALTERFWLTKEGRLGIGVAPLGPLAIAGLGVHADQAAATGAGLTTGNVYRTSAGDLKIVT